jgi:hypothetical protein
VENPAGYLLGHEANDSFVAVNRLLNSNEDVYWIRNEFQWNGKTYPAGTHFIPAKVTTQAKLERMAQEIGLQFDAVARKPAGDALMLRPLRIGLWDRYGGSMPSGWTRYVLEKFEFPFSVVFQPDLETGDLARKFDVLIFVSDSMVNPIVPQLKGFVENGGTILAIGNSTTIAYALGLPVTNAVADSSPTRGRRG